MIWECRFPMIKLPVTEQAAGGADRRTRILVRFVQYSRTALRPQSEATAVIQTERFGGLAARPGVRSAV